MLDTVSANIAVGAGIIVVVEFVVVVEFELLPVRLVPVMVRELPPKNVIFFRIVGVEAGESVVGF
jgi:hypothetical protein